MVELVLVEIDVSSPPPQFEELTIKLIIILEDVIYRLIYKLIL